MQRIFSLPKHPFLGKFKLLPPIHKEARATKSIIVKRNGINPIFHFYFLNYCLIHPQSVSRHSADKRLKV